jgi:hypothetical protein
MSKTTWLGSAAVALVFGMSAAVAQNAPGAADRRGESPQAQAPAKSERSDDRQKERSAQDNESKSGAKEVQAPTRDDKVGAKEARDPGRDDKAGQKQAQDPSQRDESKQPARQSEQKDRNNQRPPANAQRQDQEKDQKQARQPSDQKDAKQPEQKDAKQPADSRQQQTRDQQKQDSNRAAEGKDDAKNPQQQSQQPTPNNQAAQPAPANTAQDRQNQPATGQVANQPGGSASTTTQISEQQRTQVRETLSRDRATLARENQNLNIQVNVGVAIPAHVHVRSLPPDIVRIAPQYRGYEYTVVEDEIVILEPRTRKVVEVLEEPGRARQTTSRMSSTSRQVLTDDQRQTLRQSVQRTSTTGSTASSGGFDANCVTLQNLPDEMARANPDLRNYKMLTIGQQLVLIDPQQQKVVEVIE